MRTCNKIELFNNNNKLIIGSVGNSCIQNELGKQKLLRCIDDRKNSTIQIKHFNGISDRQYHLMNFYSYSLHMY